MGGNPLPQTVNVPENCSDGITSGPGIGEVLKALVLALVFVALTRVPVLRPAAYDFDEVGYLETIEVFCFPMHHTLFLASARLLGDWLGNPYRGFLALDMLTSALALTAVWWWLRALVGPKTAAASALVLGVAPVFWAYGAMAANYTAIPLVGSFLLGVAYRGRSEPRWWHPFASAGVLALGTGYRQDLGTFYLPLFLVILWRHRWLVAMQALLLFAGLNLAWLLPMLREAGGWEPYRLASAEFAHKAGYLNSVWHLGVIDAPLRYGVKLSMALLWTLGPGLLLVPRGLVRLARSEGGRFLTLLLALSVVPALGSHLLVHFGVPGYALHYVPALMALLALGIGRAPEVEFGSDTATVAVRDDSAAMRLAVLALSLAAAFLFYPTDYDQPGVRGNFDLAFSRQTRIGLQTRPPLRDPAIWRTINSQELPGGKRASAPHRSLLEVWTP
jgi:hypothetical protein